MKKIIGILSIIFLVQSCGSTSIKPDVKDNKNIDFTGHIKNAVPLDISKPVLEDNRLEKSKIGWKRAKNSYGKRAGSIKTALPVETIIANGLVEGLKQNGFAIEKFSRVSIVGSVDRFWIEANPNRWTVEFTGNVETSLRFIDNLTEKELYRSYYYGEYSESVSAPTNKTWTEIMNKALSDMIQEVMDDKDLSDALVGIWN